VDFFGEEKILYRANCRRKNLCIFCKKWLGDAPDTNYATGEAKFSDAPGMCKEDGKLHSPNEICRYFEKNLLYL